MPLSTSYPELLRRAIGSALSDVYTSEVGVIDSYDRATRTANVRVLVERAVPTEDAAEPFIYEELPILPGIPVSFPRGGGTRMLWPLAKGDTGLVLVLRSSIAAWRETGAVPCRPKDARTHHPAHAIFLAGATLVPDLTEEQGTDDPDNAIVLEPLVKVGANATDFVALATATNANFAALFDWLSIHTHPETGTNTSAPSVGPPDPEDVSATKLKSE